mgnify:CR=1 FL=1|tara:strand:+ start:240 stop:494 length:255 start_codon:yes stop_codon:yes gene_type:complete
MAKYKVYSDPGHAWIKVSRQEVSSLSLSPSSYSYERGEDVFLEEDADATAFFNAKAALGESIEQVQSYNNNQSIVRSFDRYQAR